jgi:hypothetical protein
MSNTDRNAPCPCGSGLKFKKCCLKKYEEESSFLDKLEIFNSYETKEKVVIDFFYDWLPYQMIVDKTKVEGNIPLPIAVTENTFMGDGELSKVYHHLIYGSTVSDLEAFKILVDGEKEEMLRLHPKAIGGNCPFCNESIYSKSEDPGIAVQCKLSGTKFAASVLLELDHLVNGRPFFEDFSDFYSKKGSNSK